MTARAIMVLGTASHVGKSVLAAGLCRLLSRRGVKVAPFKAQNMSNNAAVAIGPHGEADGEIGRAQALQARACGIAPRVEMNPVLLKPTGDRSSQVVVLGRARGDASAAEYRDLAPRLAPEAFAAYDRLAGEFEAVVLEGAGSCAEINLPWDFTNFPAARHAGAECLLVGDIERGGIFAQIIGTLALLAPADRARVRAAVVNKFRGDAALFDGGRVMLEERAGVPVAGVIPYLPQLSLDEEDSLGVPRDPGPREIEIAVLRLPSISNFTDLAALGREPDVRVRYVDVARSEEIGRADAVILPGAKTTRADLALLVAAGYGERIRAAREAGAEIVGLCGGLQMLGRRLRDASGVESAGQSSGLGLLAIDTEWGPEKIARLARGRFEALGADFAGYEIHAGRSRGEARVLMTDEAGRAVGWGDDRVWGAYIHGLFDEAPLRHAWLARLRARKGLAPVVVRSVRSVDRELDDLADGLGRWLRPERIPILAGLIADRRA